MPGHGALNSNDCVAVGDREDRKSVMFVTVPCGTVSSVVMIMITVIVILMLMMKTICCCYS